MASEYPVPARYCLRYRNSRWKGIRNNANFPTKCGLEVDIPPLRKDGLPIPVYWYNKEYDQAATAKLIALFRAHASVRRVLFTDSRITTITFTWN